MTDRQAIEYTKKMLEEMKRMYGFSKITSPMSDKGISKQRFNTLNHALKIIDEYEALVCPHGIKHFEHYCRECSLQRINEEYGYGEELQAELAKLREYNSKLADEVLRLGGTINGG